MNNFSGSQRSGIASVAGDGNGNLRKLIIDIISGIRHSILQIEFSFAIGFNLGNQTTLKWNCWTLPLLVLVAGISHGKYQWLATVTYQCLATVADGISAWQILSGVRLNSFSVMDSQMQDLVIKSEVWHGSLQIQRCSSIGITDPGSSLIKYFIHSTISCVQWSDPLACWPLPKVPRSWGTLATKCPMVRAPSGNLLRLAVMAYNRTLQAV